MYRRYIKRAFLAAILLIVIGVSGLAITLKFTGSSLLSVQTGSMAPTIPKGSLVRVSRVPVSTLAVGDIITYVSPLNSKITITHRIVQLPSSHNDYKFITRGDANKAPDPPITSKAIIGAVRSIVPLAGYAADFVRHPLGLLLIIYLPALSVIYEEFHRLADYYHTQKPYIATGYTPNARAKAHINRLSKAVVIAAILVIASAFIAPAAEAALRSSVSLTGTTIKTVNVTKSQQCAGGNNNINLNDSTSQSSGSGNARVTGNTGGGSASSGNASNTNSTSVNISITNC